MGTEWHQEATGDTADKLREGARRQAAPWGVCEQIALVGLHHADGRPYDPRPDVLVLPQPLPSGGMSSIALLDAGTPLFIAEIASRSTVRDDVGEKRRVYEAIGVHEYIVFDPDGALLPAPIVAWRLQNGSYVPWQPDAAGWWHSATLRLSFQADQPLLRIRGHDGHEIPATSALHSRLEGMQSQLEGMQSQLEGMQSQLEGMHSQLEEEQRQRAALDEELRRLRGGRAE